MKIDMVEVVDKSRKKIKIDYYEKKFLSVLEDDISFENRILEIRKCLNIPQEGIPFEHKSTRLDIYVDVALFIESSEEIKRIEKITKFSVSKIKKTIDRGVANICQEYSMRKIRWDMAVTLFIIYNRLVTLMADLPKSSLTFGKFVVNGWTMNTNRISNAQMFIEIHEKMSKTELIDSVKGLWNQIEKGFVKYKHSPASVPRIMTSSETLKVEKVIYDLRVRKGKSFSVIADTLSEKYNKVFSNTQANIYLDRYIKTINSLKEHNKV